MTLSAGTATGFRSGTRILVLGYVVRGPIAGHTWHHLQYVLGLSRLGHDVYFVEDSDDYPSCYDPARHTVDTDPSYGLAFASAVFDRFGLGERWCYHDAHTGSWHGPCAGRIWDICKESEVLLNVGAVNPLRPWFQDIGLRILVDTDPLFLQVRHCQDFRARDRARLHNAFFTFGENVAALRAAADDGFPWRTTRQPIVLSEWSMTPGHPHGKFTTVMQWESYPPVTHRGRTYGMKSASFGAYYDLPRLAGQKFQVALGSAPSELLNAGWHVINPLDISRDPWTYQAYIAGSKAEFSVAKHGYVACRSGWFSERSACYLASGRPVLVQDTGFSDWLATGKGVIAFDDLEAALAGVDAIETDYGSHCAAAREIAEAYFDSRHVLDALLRDAFAGVGAVL